jgi:hypothetical protein
MKREETLSIWATANAPKYLQIQFQLLSRSQATMEKNEKIRQNSSRPQTHSIASVLDFCDKIRRLRLLGEKNVKTERAVMR